jgi:hypothetical protein
MDGKFEGLLKDCVGKKVKVQRHGPDHVEGVLRYCGSDFVVVESLDGNLVICPSVSIEALGMLVDEPDCHYHDDCSHPDLETICRCSCLVDILLCYEKSIITVGSQGSCGLKGLLLEVYPDYISMMTDIKEIVHIPLWQLKFFTVGGCGDGGSRRDCSGFSGGWSGLFK